MINNPNFYFIRYIQLERSKSLKKENVVNNIFYDNETNIVTLVFNNQINVKFLFGKKNWQNNIETFIELLNYIELLNQKGIKYKRLIAFLAINLVNNWEKIIGIDNHYNIHNNNNHTKQNKKFYFPKIAVLHVDSQYEFNKNSIILQKLFTDPITLPHRLENRSKILENEICFPLI